MTKTISNVVVKRVTYLRSDLEKVDFGTVKEGAAYNNIVKVEYSNLSKVYGIALKGGEASPFKIDQTGFAAHCGDYGEVPVAVTFDAKAGEYGIFEDVIVVENGDGVAAHKIEIPVRAKVGKEQVIAWEQELTAEEKYIGAVVPLTAVTNAAEDGGAVTYASDNEQVAVVEGSTLKIVGAGDVNVTAKGAETVHYEAAPDVVKNIHVDELYKLTLMDQSEKSESIVLDTELPVKPDREVNGKNWKFIGWSETEKPGVLAYPWPETIMNGSYHAAKSVTLYAIYVSGGDNGFNAAGSDLTVEPSAKNDVTVDGDQVLAGKAYDNMTVKSGCATTTGASAMNLHVYDNASVATDGNFAAMSVTYSKVIDNNGWHFFSVPFDCAIADIRFVTVEGGEGITWKYGENIRIERFDEAAYANRTVKDGWEIVTDQSYVLKANQGYLAATKVAGATVEMRFEKKTAEVIAKSGTETSMPVGFTAEGDSKYKGFNLVAHPYYAPMESNVKMRSANAVVTYVSVPKADGTYIQKSFADYNTQIKTHEPFFVQMGEASELTFAAEPASAARAAYGMMEGSNGEIELRLTDMNGAKDVTTVINNPATTTEYEIGKDLVKLFAEDVTAPQIYTLNGGARYAFNAQKVETQTAVKVGMRVAEAGTYKIGVESMMGDIYSALLYDSKTGETTDLTKYDYEAELEKGANDNRFELRFSRVSVDCENPDAAEIEAWTEGGEIVVSGAAEGSTVAVADMSGRIVAGTKAGAERVRMAVAQEGVYCVIVRSESGVKSIRVAL